MGLGYCDSITDVTPLPFPVTKPSYLQLITLSQVSDDPESSEIIVLNASGSFFELLTFHFLRFLSIIARQSPVRTTAPWSTVIFPTGPFTFQYFSNLSSLIVQPEVISVTLFLHTFVLLQKMICLSIK